MIDSSVISNFIQIFISDSISLIDKENRISVENYFTWQVYKNVHALDILYIVEIYSLIIVVWNTEF